MRTGQAVTVLYSWKITRSVIVPATYYRLRCFWYIYLQT